MFLIQEIKKANIDIVEFLEKGMDCFSLFETKQKIADFLEINCKWNGFCFLKLLVQEIHPQIF